MKFHTLFAAVLLCLGPAADGVAQDNTCGPGFSTEAASLSALPAGLRAALASASRGGRIADVSENFNSTDVIADVPDERFRSGRLTGDCAAVLVEQGRGQNRTITISSGETGTPGRRARASSRPPSGSVSRFRLMYDQCHRPGNGYVAGLTFPSRSTACTPKNTLSFDSALV